MRSLLILKVIWLVLILSFTGVVKVLLNSHLCPTNWFSRQFNPKFQCCELPRHLKHESLELAATYIMANTHRPTKQWSLAKNETQGSTLTVANWTLASKNHALACKSSETQAIFWPEETLDFRFQIN